MATDDLERLDADDLGQSVPAVYARSVAEADQYAQLLLDHDIPHVVDEDYEPDAPADAAARNGSVPVLVPESFLDEARDIIAEFDEMVPFTDEDDQPVGQEFQDDDEYGSLGVAGAEVLLPGGEDEEEDEQEEDEDVEDVDGLDDEDEDDKPC